MDDKPAGDVIKKQAKTRLRKRKRRSTKSTSESKYNYQPQTRDWTIQRIRQSKSRSQSYREKRQTEPVEELESTMERLMRSIQSMLDSIRE